MIQLNDKRRNELRHLFKNKKGIHPVIEFTQEYIKNNPRGYLASYTHYLEENLIKAYEALKTLSEM
jgi:hypothetical protein